MTVFFFLSFFQDVQYFDIDYMNNFKDFTFDEKRYLTLPAFVDELHDKERKAMIVLVCIEFNIVYHYCVIYVLY